MAGSRNPIPTAVGDPAPPLEFLDAAGRPWRLADQRGAITVLIFHRHIH